MASFLFDVLPCCEISDHDGPYIGIKVRMKQYQPRIKYICDNSKLYLKIYSRFSKITIQ